MLRHREDAADAVQQAFVVALTKRHLIPADNPWPWLAGVIAREAQHMRRKRARVAAMDAGGPAMPVEDTKSTQALAELVERERDEQLTRALEELPTEERDALMITKVGGLTYAEAAEALGVPLGTLNHRISRALAALRHKLRDKDEPAIARALAVLPVAAVPDDLRNALKLTAFGAAAKVAASMALGGIAVKKTTALVLAVLLVLLMGAGVGAVLMKSADTEQDHLISTQLPSQNAGVDSPRNNPPEASEASSPPANASNEAVALDGSKLPDDAPPPDAMDRRVMVATDPGGNPVSLKFVMDWRMDNDTPWSTRQISTGADGRALLDVPLEAMLRLNLDQAGWSLGWRNFTLPAGQKEQSVTVYPLKPLRVRVTYADGAPYAGLLTVEADKLWQAGLQIEAGNGSGTPVPAGWPTLPERFTGSYKETVEFEGLPVGVEITFSTTAPRAGYAELKRTVTPAEVEAGELIELVSPEGVSPRTPGQIRLSFDDGEQPEGKTLLFKVQQNGSKSTAIWGSRNPQQSGKIWTGRYLVVFLGANAWQSDEFELAPGEIKELRPVLSPAAHLAARVVDEAGKPVAGAVLAFGTDDLPNTVRRRNSGTPLPVVGEAISDPEGRLRLADLPAGTIKYQIWAQGMQLWEGYATLIEGQECDIGEVRLETAKGRIEVQLPAWDYSARKLTWTLTDGEMRTIERGTVESNTLTIEGLSVGRSYMLQIHISTPRGARTFWFTKPFELTTAVPTHKLDGTDKEWPKDLD